jgi:alanine racemase
VSAETGGQVESRGVDQERVVAYINLTTLEANYNLIRSKVPAGVKLLCVVKADAYGHGVLPIARLLEGVGVDYLGVATMSEGIFLREQGVICPILVMGGFLPWEEIKAAADKRLSVVLHDFMTLERILGIALSGPRKLHVHVKVDTGMGRLGFTADALPDVFSSLKKVDGVVIEGMMSHFASSEQRDEYGMGQTEQFREALKIAAREGVVPGIAHMANSGAITVYPEALFDMVRVGISLYGSHPDKALADLLPVTQVMKVASRIASIKNFPAGAALSYGRTFVTEGPMKIAYVPVGYADGYPRSLSNRGVVLIGGERRPIVGRICMDWFLVDVTGLGDVHVGDTVVLLGRDKDEAITADEIAEQAGTIPYEILCKISARVPRIYA